MKGWFKFSLHMQAKKTARYLLFTFWVLVFTEGYTQSVFDSVQVQTDSITFSSGKLRNGSTAMIDSSTADSIVKATNTVTSDRKKIKNNQFVWNDRKYRSDTLSGIKVKRHSPLYATLFSLAVPGLGQAYNRKYWKIPIVYAGLGGLGYALYYTTSNFYGYRNAYRLQVDEDPNTYGEYKGVNNSAELKSYRDYYKRYVDLTAILTGVWYALNLVDAAVDAHLFDWNMKDDIHLSWRPVVLPSQNQASVAPGVHINLSF